MTLMGTAPTPFGRGATRASRLASLDHAMWFHRAFDIDDWLLYEQKVLSVAGSRALRSARCTALTVDSSRTVMQNGLVEIAGAGS